MWKPKRKQMSVADIKRLHERERTSLQNIFHFLLMIAISAIVWLAFNACTTLHRAHMCEDKANEIECARWKQNHPKEYARYEKRLSKTPRGR